MLCWQPNKTSSCMPHTSPHTFHIMTGEVPERRGNGGYGGIPSQAFMCADRQIFVVVGNNAQYERFCAAIERPELFTDERFCTGPLRIANRKLIVPILEEIFRQKSAAEWVEAIDRAGVPVSYVNDIAQVFEEEQVKARHMRIDITHPVAGPLALIANPLRFSETPVGDYTPPPDLGEHSDEVLSRLLGIGAVEVEKLRSEGIVG